MTNLEYVAQCSGIVFGLILIFKLLNLRLHRVYRLFSFFLCAELLSSVIWFTQHFLRESNVLVDYRLLWVALRALSWPLMILTVYALLSAVLRNLPGILTLSQRFLNATFVVAVIVGALSAAWEYHRFNYGSRVWQANVYFGGVIAERVVSSIVLIAILSILGFLLWFPVPIPRNLASFVVGFSMYSAGTCAGLLTRSLAAHDAWRPVSTSIELLMVACLGFWVVFISEAGETVPTKLNIRRNPQDQDRLIQHLELLNRTLLHSGSHNADEDLQL